MIKYYLHILLVLPAVFSLPVTGFAQAEIEQERSSLRGLTGVGFTVNIEQNTVFADSQLVKIDIIKKQGTNVLKKANIRVYSDSEVRSSATLPVLYLHINSLSTQNGLISFAININLYQPVKLVLNHHKQVTASTWDDGLVGLVSYDNTAFIKEEAMGLIESFLHAYYEANPNRLRQQP